MRTGGTAVMRALGRVPELYTYYEPLHPAMAQPYSAIAGMTSTTWNSKHPELAYWDTVAPLVRDDRVELFQPRFLELSRPADDDAELIAYLDRLMEVAREHDRIPVLGLEQGELLLPWLRARYPDALHVGVSRSPQETLVSWLEQLVQGNPGFVDAAWARVASAPDAFAIDMDGRERTHDALLDVAQRYIEVTNRIRRDETDMVLDMDALDPEALGEPLVRLGVSPVPFVDDLTTSRPPVDPVDSLRRIAAYEDRLLVHQRQLAARVDQLTADVDGLRAREADLVRQSQEVSAWAQSLERDLLAAHADHAAMTREWQRPSALVRALWRAVPAAVRRRLRHEPVPEVIR